jgi:hypothetical protein
MKKFLATAFVLGGVAIGSSIYAADTPKANPHPQDEKKIVLVEKEAALQSTIQRFYEELKSEMNKNPAKKQDSTKNSAGSFQEPEKMGRVALGVINGKLKDDENKVAASVNANVVFNNGRLENMVVSGHAGLADIAMNYDVRSGNTTTNLSANNKGNRVDVTLRNYKDPIIRAQFKVSNNVSSGFVYDSKTNYSSVNFAVNYNRMNGSVSYENINNAPRTTTSIRYSPNFKPIKFVSLTHVEYNGVNYYAFDIFSKLKDFDIGFNARKIGPGKSVPSFMIRYAKKW